MPKKKKKTKTPKKKSKKQGARKGKKDKTPATTPEKPEKGGGVVRPEPKNLPKVPPRAPKKPNAGGRPAGSKDKEPRKIRSPREPGVDEETTTPPVGPEVPPVPPLPPPGFDDQGRDLKVLNFAKLATGLTNTYYKRKRPPEMDEKETEMILDGWYLYLVEEGPTLPPWLGLLFVNAIVFLGREAPPEPAPE